jgi:hypothetical protein
MPTACLKGAKEATLAAVDDGYALSDLLILIARSTIGEPVKVVMKAAIHVAFEWFVARLRTSAASAAFAFR